MKFARESYENLPYPQPWEWIRDNINFEDNDLFFVDVGAYDGISSSNTGYFEIDLGWKGICIEPLPSAFKLLQQNRNCLLYNCCISNIEGDVNFLALTGYTEMLSGIYSNYSENHLQRVNSELQKHGGKSEIVKIKSRKLSSILKENSITKIDYLSIDVEGGELSVLKSINFNEVDVCIISAENSSNNSNVNNFLNELGYEFLTKCCCDEIYCKK